jgi:hypothetical protein
MEEGDSTRVGFDSRTPENEICFWDFLRIMPDVWSDSTPRALTRARRFCLSLYARAECENYGHQPS